MTKSIFNTCPVCEGELDGNGDCRLYHTWDNLQEYQRGWLEAPSKADFLVDLDNPDPMFPVLAEQSKS